MTLAARRFRWKLTAADHRYCGARADAAGAQAYELSTLTGTQVLLLVASETGHVYTFATPKLQPLITKPDGKNLIQACLNAPEAQNMLPTNSPVRASKQRAAR